MVILVQEKNSSESMEDGIHSQHGSCFIAIYIRSEKVLVVGQIIKSKNQNAISKERRQAPIGPKIIKIPKIKRKQKDREMNGQLKNYFQFVINSDSRIRIDQGQPEKNIVARVGEPSDWQ